MDDKMTMERFVFDGLMKVSRKDFQQINGVWFYRGRKVIIVENKNEPPIDEDDWETKMCIAMGR